MKEKILKLIEIGYSYRYLARICDVHHTTLSNWCNGTTELTPTIKNRIKKNLLSHISQINKIIGDENENWD
jgi:plasmid maintenance system antidote protein VapI